MALHGAELMASGIRARGLKEQSHTVTVDDITT
jgi:hypothetical protein